MVEPTTPRNLPPSASLFLARPSRVEWHDNLHSADKNNVFGKSVPAWQDEEEDNNQESDEPHGADDVDGQEESKCSPQRREGGERKLHNDELQQLKIENSTLVQRLARMEIQHAERVGTLEAKLQQAIENHKEIEQRLKSQLETVLHEQQAAVENARKVRTILTRVSGWVRQVQRSAQTERPSLHVVKPVDHDLELRMTPRTDSPYRLWASGASLATNVLECHESPTAFNKFTLNQDPLQWPAPDCYGVQIDINVNSLPPPAPGRKNIPDKGFNYVGFNVPSPSNRSAEVVPQPLAGTEIILDGLPLVSRRGTPVPKRSAGGLLSYCAQVVTTSLAGVRSSTSPLAKVTPAWKLDRLAPLREEPEIDEEAGQCSPLVSSRGQHLNVALPSLSIGLL